MAHHRSQDDRSITASRLSHLLRRLDPDVDRAGAEYERLRRALVRFFDWRGAALPESCADDTIDRLARKLDDTVVDDVDGYAHGIARLVLLERRRDPALVPLGDETGGAVPPPTLPGDAPYGERLRDCFERCLDALAAEDRTMLVRYYEGERSARIANRREMAAALQLSDNALRSRVQRLRDRLEKCVGVCVSAR